MRRLSLIALLATALAVPVLAQGQPPPPPATTAPGVPPTAQQQPAQPPPSTATRPPAGQRGGRGTPGQPPAPATTQAGRGGRPEAPSQNIRIDVAITDLAEKTTKKVVSMIVAERDSGRIRSGNNAGMLNVDGFPRVEPDGRIHLSLTVEYQPDRASNSTLLNQSIALLLVAGKPTLISQSADPNSDRKVTVEVTATVIK